MEWIKIDRDENGFAIEECLESMRKAIPFVYVATKEVYVAVGNESGYLTVEIINNVNLMFITDTSEQRVISFIHENLYESMIKCIKWLIKEDYFNKEYLKHCNKI